MVSTRWWNGKGEGELNVLYETKYELIFYSLILRDFFNFISIWIIFNINLWSTIFEVATLIYKKYFIILINFLLIIQQSHLLRIPFRKISCRVTPINIALIFYIIKIKSSDDFHIPLVYFLLLSFEKIKNISSEVEHNLLGKYCSMNSRIYCQTSPAFCRIINHIQRKKNMRSGNCIRWNLCVICGGDKSKEFAGNCIEAKRRRTLEAVTQERKNVEHETIITRRSYNRKKVITCH